MALRFRGEYTNKVDGKGRVSIPAPFRRVLKEGDPDTEAGNLPTVVVNFGRNNGCLEAYSIAAIDRIDDLIEAMPMYARERQALSRLISGQSVYIPLDGDGRIILSADLRTRAGLTDRAVFVGMTDRFQIWEPEAYAADMANLTSWVKDRSEEDDLYELLHQAQERYGT